MYLAAAAELQSIVTRKFHQHRKVFIIRHTIQIAHLVVINSNLPAAGEGVRVLPLRRAARLVGYTGEVGIIYVFVFGLDPLVRAGNIGDPDLVDYSLERVCNPAFGSQVSNRSRVIG